MHFMTKQLKSFIYLFIFNSLVPSSSVFLMSLGELCLTGGFN